MPASARPSRRRPSPEARRGATRPAPMTTTRPNVSATNRMSWLIAMTVRPAARQVGDDPLDAGDAPRVLAGRRLVEHDDRRLHREDRGQRQQLAARVAEVVRVGIDRGRSSPTASRAAAAAAGRLGRCPSEDLRAELDLGPDLAGEDLAIRVLEDDPDPGRERGDPLVRRRRRRRAGRGPPSVAAGRRGGGPSSTCRSRSGR